MDKGASFLKTLRGDSAVSVKKWNTEMDQLSTKMIL